MFPDRAEELETAVRLLPESEFVGVNLTIPHKIPALTIMDELHSNVRDIGAVNTVVVRDRTLIGDNTDGPGFAPSDSERVLHGSERSSRPVAWRGGRCRAGNCETVRPKNCERLVLVNRTFDKAKRMVAELAGFAAARVLGPVARLEAVP